jgi:UDP-glucose 4-epimerase
MKILITGHKGFVGSYLTKTIDDLELPIIYTGIDLKDGNDILDCELPDVDVVIHLAALPGVIDSMNRPVENAKTNIVGTIRLAEHYKDKKFIFASSGGTVQEKIESPYGLSKYCGEEYIKLLCNNYVILRFPNIYGPDSRSVVDKFLKNKDNIIYGNGTQTRTYGHINDIIRAIIMSLEWDSGLYKLGDKNQNFTINEIANAIGGEFKYEEKRKGELDFSSLDNTAPNWKQEIDLMEYIKMKK